MARGTGRTTRMLREAVEAAMDGKTVFVVGCNSAHLPEMRRIAKNFLDPREYLDFNGAIRLRSGGQILFRLYPLDVQERRVRESVVFTDHAVWEHAAADRCRNYSPEQFRREQRFDYWRSQGKKLGEINALLEQEGFEEAYGEGVMPYQAP